MRRRSWPVAAFYLLNLYPSVWRVVALVIAEMYVGRRVVCRSVCCGCSALGGILKIPID